MDGQYRKNIQVGKTVWVVQKQDQRNGKLSAGTVSKILTRTAFHPHGIKVQLQNGRVGRVKKIE